MRRFITACTKIFLFGNEATIAPNTTNDYQCTTLNARHLPPGVCMRAALALAFLVSTAIGQQRIAVPRAPTFHVSFPAARSAMPLDGRLLVLLSTDSSSEPRFQTSNKTDTAQIFGLDVEGWKPGETVIVDRRANRPARGFACRGRGDGRHCAWVGHRPIGSGHARGSPA